MASLIENWDSTFNLNFIHFSFTFFKIIPSNSSLGLAALLLAQVAMFIALYNFR